MSDHNDEDEDLEEELEEVAFRYDTSDIKRTDYLSKDRKVWTVRMSAKQKFDAMRMYLGLRELLHAMEDQLGIHPEIEGESH